jgi:hypothetical protein
MLAVHERELEKALSDWLMISLEDALAGYLAPVLILSCWPVDRLGRVDISATRSCSTRW